MDPRLENWKREYGVENIPPEMMVTFNVANFPKMYPDYVKEAFSKMRVPLRRSKPEFKSGVLFKTKSEGGGSQMVSEGSNFTYEIVFRTLLLALNKIDPRAAEWFESEYAPTGTVVFNANQIESIVD